MSFYVNCVDILVFVVFNICIESDACADPAARPPKLAVESTSSHEERTSDSRRPVHAGIATGVRRDDLASSSLAGVGEGDEGEPEEGEAPRDAATNEPVESPFRYSVPWQLRPLPAPTVLRFDNTLALDEDRLARRGKTLVSFLTAAARVPGTGPRRAGLNLLIRAGFVSDVPPGGGGDSLLVNLLIGAAYAVRLPDDWLLNFFVGSTLPVGMGGGETPSPARSTARSRGAVARSQLDNPIFAVNDLGVASGVGVGWVAHGWTVQLEATFAHVVRVRGDRVQRERTKTNSAFGVHVGYFIAPFLSANTELRYQRWLNEPFAVTADPTHAGIDNLTVALGPRFHVETILGWLRPGVAYVRPLDKPMAAASSNVHILQFDVPLFF